MATLVRGSSRRVDPRIAARCASAARWSRPTEPFRIVGNVYWVGTYDLSSYLITSPDGHIVINTGLPDSVPQIRANIEQLGFKIADVKILTATHAHWDHVAGLAALKKITGASVYMSAPDADVLESGGKSDFRWGKDPQAWFDPVTVDRRLADGDTIRLGGNVLTLHLHAGHSKGASSFTFTVRDGTRDYRVGIINMGSINPGVRVSGMPGFPTSARPTRAPSPLRRRWRWTCFSPRMPASSGCTGSASPEMPTMPTGSWIPRASARRWMSWRRRFKKQLATERQP